MKQKYSWLICVEGGSKAVLRLQAAGAIRWRGVFGQSLLCAHVRRRVAGLSRPTQAVAALHFPHGSNLQKQVVLRRSLEENRV